jgi:biotin transport system substrate-specific component
MNKDHDVAVASGTLEWRALSGPRVRRAALTLGLVAAGIGILTASSWLSVPFYPVPLTMQTLAVLLVGGLLGPRKGPAAVAGYLALGLAGAPVFHNGLGGFVVLLGPTGGYLLGFVPAAFVMGLIARHLGFTAAAWSARPARTQGRHSRGAAPKEIALLSVGALLAEAAIYLCGVPWLAVAYTGGDLGRALAVGAVPYLLGDVLKVAVAVGALHLGAAALRGRRLSSL